jgi:hypothetical protein
MPSRRAPVAALSSILAQPYIWAAAVFVNELDTSQFKSPQRRTSVGRYHNVRLGKIAALEKQRS